MKTIHQRILVVNAVGIGPGQITATATGTGVDRQDYDELLMFARYGAIGGTTVTIDAKLQDSADNTTFADVTGATFAQLDETGDNTFHFGRCNAQGLRRYVRIVVTITGTSPTVDIYGGIILGEPTQLPVVGHGSAQFNLNPAVTS